MNKNKIALVYDFDKTLSPKDMQEFHLLKRLGYQDPIDFWNKCNSLKMEDNVDGILAYMYLLAKEDPSITKEDLILEGSYVELFNGVEAWFSHINEYALSKGLEIEHYIISSGIKEIIEGTSIAKEFKEIYACSYCYDEKSHILWPSRVVNYTTKTQYLFRINKGVLDERNDVDLNRSTSDEDKYIPFERMIYFGDGLTDVPSMKVVSGFNGYTIAVFKDESSLAKELFDDKRANFYALADYSPNGRIDDIVKGIIDKIASDMRLDNYR